MNPISVLFASLLPVGSFQVPLNRLDENWIRSDSAVICVQLYLGHSGSFDAIEWQKIQSAPAPIRYLHGSWERKGARLILKMTNSAMGSVFGPQLQPDGHTREPEYFPWRPNVSGPVVGTISRDDQTIRISDPFGYSKTGKGWMIPLKRTDIELRSLDWNTIDLAIKHSKVK